MKKKKRNYHMCMSPVDPASNTVVRRWRCDYCGKIDTLENLRSFDCTYIYDTCKHCGGCEESNECKPDCKGVLAALADPSVYIAGLGPPREKNA